MVSSAPCGHSHQSLPSPGAPPHPPPFLQVLRSLGLNPSLLACRCQEPIEPAVREKLVSGSAAQVVVVVATGLAEVYVGLGIGLR